MISGIGVDIENIKRFEKACENKNFLNLIFTDKEIIYCKNKKKPYMSFAGKFCAKESIIKAYDKKIILKNIEIINLESGKSEVRINGKINNRVKCSISHTNDYAVAFVVIEK
ncbi:MAG: holo-ACP synthase [Nanoarchaeota archaeon]|nr:holo-ACP synthase [Nanoarchaeota archaeon]